MSYNYLFTIPYTNLFVWAVKSFYKNEITSNYPVEPLGRHINEEYNKIVLSDYPDEEFHILGVNNTDGIIDAYSAKGKTFKQSYKIMNKDFIAYNPYRVNVGSIGIKKDQKGNLISPAYVVFSCKETILPDYLFLLMKGAKFNELVRQNTSGSVRQNLTFKSLSRIRIPVPTIEEQQNLIDEYKCQISEVNDINIDYMTVDDCIKRKLSIEKLSFQSTSQKVLDFIEFTNFYNWDIKSKSRRNILESNLYKMVSLSQIAKINPLVEIDLPNDAEISFVPMECVSDFDGEVIEYRIITKGTKGYTKFCDGDIIWAKITPCMQNGKSAVVQGMTNGFGYGSTEFHVIRVNNNLALTKYVYYILRMLDVRNEAKQYFTGSAGQQRVNSNYLNNLMLPLPSLEIQTQLVQELDKLKLKIKQNRQRKIDLSKQAKRNFEEAIFG